MTKNDAANLFNGIPALALALGITRHAIYQWPDDLRQEQQDRVIGAAIRLGLYRISPSADGRNPTGEAPTGEGGGHRATLRPEAVGE